MFELEDALLQMLDGMLETRAGLLDGGGIDIDEIPGTQRRRSGTRGEQRAAIRHGGQFGKPAERPHQDEHDRNHRHKTDAGEQPRHHEDGPVRALNQFQLAQVQLRQRRLEHRQSGGQRRRVPRGRRLDLAPQLFDRLGRDLHVA